MSGPPTEPSPEALPTPAVGQPGRCAAPTSPASGRLATLALDFGIAGLFTLGACVPAALIALILGIVATVRTSRDPRRYQGKGIAVTAIIVGVVGMALLPGVLLPSLGRMRLGATRAVSVANLRGVWQGLKIYSDDNSGVFPQTLQALVDNGLCTRKQFVSLTSGSHEGTCDYHYVTGLAPNDPSDWIVLFEDPARRGGDGGHIAYLDGTVRFVKEGRRKQFTQEISRFKAAYEKARGQPPVIIPPGPITLPPAQTPAGNAAPR